MDNNKKFKMHIVPHTHWDREWYYTLEEFRFRLVRLIDTLLDCMDQDKIKYFVLDGQTIALKDYLERRPENRERIERLTKADRILIGPWYTQPNMFMSCGEAQLRNLDFGRRDIKKWGGDLNVNYMPDMFGFSAQLPQMMKGYGLETMIGGRGMDKGSDTFFLWTGSDGTEVYACALPHSYINAHCISTRDEAQNFDVFGCNIRMAPLKDNIDVVLSERVRCPAPQLLALNGVDHMFPNPTMLETVEKINRDFPEVEAVQSNFKLYINDVLATLEKDLYRKSGELRDPRENLILPASQSMRMDVKQKNIECEDALIRNAEPTLAVMRVLNQDKLPEVDLDAAWEILLQNHAHDSLCCSNSEPSYREIMSRYDKISDITRESLNDMDQHFIRLIDGMPKEAVIVKNPSAFDRDEPIELEIITSYWRNFSEPHLFVEGNEIPCRINGVRGDMLLRFVPFSGRVGELQVAIFSVTAYPGIVPALGYKTIEIRGGGVHPRTVDGLVTSSDSMENDFLKVKINSDGTVTVTDKRNGEIYSDINAFTDDGEAGNGFQHVAPYKDEIYTSHGENLSVIIEQNSPEIGIIRTEQTFSLPKSLSEDRLGRSKTKNNLTIKSRIILKKGVTRVDFETSVDNTAKDHRLRVSFPTDTKTDSAYCGQPFDVIRRPVQPENVNALFDGDYEPYVGYHPMQDFCGIEDGKRGVAVAAGLLEYEVLPRRNTLALTLIRATDRLLVGVLDQGSKFRLPAAQLQKEMNFRYSFIPYEGGYENALKDIDAARHPLKTVQKDFLEEQSMPTYIAPDKILPISSGFIKIEGNMLLTSLRPSLTDRNEITVRFINPCDTEEKAKLIINDNYKLNSAEFVRLDETEPDVRFAGSIISDNQIAMTVGHKQIVTIKLNICLKNKEVKK